MKMDWGLNGIFFKWSPTVINKTKLQETEISYRIYVTYDHDKMNIRKKSVIEGRDEICLANSIPQWRTKFLK